MLAAAVVATWLAQAEPAPSGSSAAAPVTAGPPAPPPTPDNTVSVYVGVGHRVGPEAQTFAPRTDISIGGSYRWRYFTLPEGLELAAGVDFFYDQFRNGVEGNIVSQNSFVAIQTFAWRWRRLRPFLLGGAGVSFGYAQVDGAQVDSAQPLVRGGAGLDITVTHNIGLSLRGTYTLLLTRPTVTVPATLTTAAVSYSPLGNFLDADLGVFFQF
ncbi:MAG TPA: hypothetical protein VKZ18_10585 [Polyangia bacterium]|nr:hypothetical protein [Polyangia bacterium]